MQLEILEQLAFVPKQYLRWSACQKASEIHVLLNVILSNKR